MVVKYAAFPPMGSMGAKLIQISPVHYQRAALARIDSSSTAVGRRTLVTPEMGVALHGVMLTVAQRAVDLNVSAVWDDAQYATAAERAGKDFCLYAIPGGLILSANATVPLGYTAETSRLIGGLHCLCLSVGTISGHALTGFLTGFLTGDILPGSIWDLNWRPICSPEGMVFARVADVWVDIYLQSGTGTATRSANMATTTDTRTYWDHGDDLAAVGKRMLLDMEFSQIAYGSPEATNILGSADPVTTGGHVDTASRRIISSCGCEDCAGVMWQWTDGGHVYRNHDSVYNGAWSWKSTNGRGQQYTQGADGAVGLLAGGYWNAGSACGSRSRIANNARSSANSNVGSRGCARRQA